MEEHVSKDDNSEYVGQGKSLGMLRANEEYDKTGWKKKFEAKTLESERTNPKRNVLPVAFDDPEDKAILEDLMNVLAVPEKGPMIKLALRYLHNVIHGKSNELFFATIAKASRSRDSARRRSF